MFVTDKALEYRGVIVYDRFVCYPIVRLTHQKPKVTRLSQGIFILCVAFAGSACHDGRTSVTGSSLTAADLIGTWSGIESWGTRYTIIRSANGTFTETIDSSHADVPGNLPFITAKGRWALKGNQYSITYTEKSDEITNFYRVRLFTITPKSRTCFSYSAEEGNGVSEQKL
jgi:hypothetical protein